jgi:PAS domain S-box-containing protein
VLPSSLSETEQAIAVARVSDAAFVDVSDGFCTLVGRRRDELLGRTAAELGISHRDRLDWLISRFPERGRSHHQQRVFETPLRPAILHDQGRFRALHVLVAQIAREVGAEGTVAGISRRYDLAAEELVYRCTQEALANVRKHAHPRTIAVTLVDDDAVLRVDVRDDGCGFDVESVRSRPDAALHFGLDTMIERIRAAGGEAMIDSEVGSGTTVSFTVPLAAPVAHDSR